MSKGISAYTKLDQGTFNYQNSVKKAIISEETG